MPRDADRIVGALLDALWRAHQLQRLPLENALSIRGGAVAHVKPSVRQQVGDAESHSARRDARRRHEWALKRWRPVARRVPRGEALHDELTRSRARVLES